MKYQNICLKSRAFMLLLTALSPIRAGESPPRCPKTNERTQNASFDEVERAKLQDYTAGLLDRLQQHLEEWGVVTISDPILLPAGNDFDLGPELSFPTASNYITAESTSINAAAAQFTQSALVAQLSASEQLSANASKGNAGSSNATSSSGGAAGQEDTGATLPKTNAKDFQAQQGFAAAGSLVPTPTGIAERDAVNNGIGDKLTEKTLRLQANPYNLKDGLKRYFLVFQVTCNPGWRTLRGYMADLQVQFEYGLPDPCGGWTYSLSVPGRSQPHIIAALPLMDAQNIELGNSQRALQSLSLALAAAGPNTLGSASGKGLLDYIKSYQSDASSRQAMPVVNSYTSGTTFGFRFSPSFLALVNPAKKHSNSENQLVPTAFPVLLLISINPNDVLSGEKRKYTHLISRYSYHWMLRDHEVSLFPWKMPKRREDERTRIELARNVDNALNTFKAAYNDVSPADKAKSLVLNTFRSDYFELEQKCLGRVSFAELPTDLFSRSGLRPHISHVVPGTIDPDMDTVVVIEGKYFTANPKAVVIGGRQCPIITSTESTIVAQISKGVLADGRFFEPDDSSPTDGKADVVVITDVGPSNFSAQTRLTVRPHDNHMRKFVLVHDSDIHAQPQSLSPQAAADQAAADQAAADKAAADKSTTTQTPTDKKVTDPAKPEQPNTNPPQGVNVSVGNISNTSAASTPNQALADKTPAGQTTNEKNPPDQKNHDQTSFEFREQGNWQTNEQLINATSTIMTSPPKTNQNSQPAPTKTPTGQ